MNRVAFDTDFLSLLLHPQAKPPTDAATGKPVIRCPGRIKYLVETLEAGQSRIIIPTPVLAEFLVLAGEAASDYLTEITSHAVFQVAPFDEMAAIESAAMARRAIEAGDKRAGVTAPWQQIKIDRQILAIARTQRCGSLYSSDETISALAKALSYPVIGVSALPIPPPEDRPLPFPKQPSSPGAISGDESVPNEPPHPS